MDKSITKLAKKLNRIYWYTFSIMCGFVAGFTVGMIAEHLLAK